MNESDPGATDDAFTEPHNLPFPALLRVSLPARVPPTVSPPVLCRYIPLACIYKVAGANGCSLDETHPSCRTCRQESAPTWTERELNFFFLCPAQIYNYKSYFSKNKMIISRQNDWWGNKTAEFLTKHKTIATIIKLSGNNSDNRSRNRWLRFGDVLDSGGNLTFDLSKQAV